MLRTIAVPLRCRALIVKTLMDKCLYDLVLDGNLLIHCEGYGSVALVTEGHD